MISVIYHPVEQEALAHIILFHNPFYRPSLYDSWFKRTPVEELGHMRALAAGRTDIAKPMLGLGLCHHTLEEIYPHSYSRQAS